MASAWVLRQQINEQKRLLESINRNQAELRKKIEQEAEQKIRAMERQLRSELEQSRQEMDADFQNYVTQSQQRMAAERQELIDELRRAEENARRERSEKLRELERLNAELRQELESIKSETTQMHSFTKEYALELKQKAVQQEKVVRNLPHQFFHPGQLDILDEHLAQIDCMIDAEMYDAAAATADSVLAELQIFEITLNENQRDWSELFGICKRLITALHDQIKTFEAQPIRTPAGDFSPMPEEQLDYWSSGSYSAIRKKVMDEYEASVLIAKDIGSFLSQNGGIAINQYQNQIRLLHRLAEQVSAAITCIQSERFYSDERFVLAQQAMDYLCSQAYQIQEEETGFRIPPDGEPIDAFEVSATINGLDYLHLSFVPVRENGVTVRNICLITVELQTVYDENLIEGIAANVANALTNRSSVQAEWNANGLGMLEDQECSLKKKPNVGELAKKLERKN